MNSIHQSSTITRINIFDLTALLRGRGPNFPAQTHRRAQPLSSGPASEGPAAKRRTNSLGMVLVDVPGTDALFQGVWTRLPQHHTEAAPADMKIAPDVATIRRE